MSLCAKLKHTATVPPMRSAKNYGNAIDTGGTRPAGDVHLRLPARGVARNPAGESGGDDPRRAVKINGTIAIYLVSHDNKR